MVGHEPGRPHGRSAATDPQVTYVDMCPAASATRRRWGRAGPCDHVGAGCGTRWTSAPEDHPVEPGEGPGGGDAVGPSPFRARLAAAPRVRGLPDPPRPG